MKKLLGLPLPLVLLTGCSGIEETTFSFRAEIVEIGICISNDWRETCAVKLKGDDGTVFIANTDVAPMVGMVVKKSCTMYKSGKVRCYSNWMENAWRTYDDTFEDAKHKLRISHLVPSYGV